MREILRHRYLIIGCRLTLGALFLFAGLPKVLDPRLFLMDVRGYMLVPNSIVPLVTLVLPMLEVILGVCLIAGIWIRTSAFIGAALLVLFLVAIIAAMTRGLDIECGCFGRSDSKVGPWKLFENLCFMALTIPLLASRNMGRRSEKMTR